MLTLFLWQLHRQDWLAGWLSDPILNLTGTATTGATAHGAIMLITALAITSVLFALRSSHLLAWVM